MLNSQQLALFVPDNEFSMRDTHQIAAMPNHKMLASSEGLGWRTIYAVVQRESPYDAYLDEVKDHFFVFHLRGSVAIQWSLAGNDFDGHVTPGHYEYFPCRQSVGVQLKGTIETMHLYLRNSIVEQVSADIVASSNSRGLRPVFNGSDPLLVQLAMSIRLALNERRMASRLYVEHLSWTFAAHLVHSSRQAVLSAALRSQGLSRRQLQRVVEFIEENLEKDLGVEDLARAASLNPAYFGRQFKKATNLSPHQFVTQRRVERAKRLLAVDGSSIADIAVACGFCHQEHLTRTFRARCGITPAAYREASIA
jgi:AraC family transcriptional regulator